VTSRLDTAAQHAEEEARRREESTGAQREALTTAVNELHERVSGTLTEAQNSLREQLARELESAQAALAGYPGIRDSGGPGAGDESVARGDQGLPRGITGRGRQAEHQRARSNGSERAATGRYSGARQWRVRTFGAARCRIETVQQQAVTGFQSQLDEVLSLHAMSCSAVRRICLRKFTRASAAALKQPTARRLKSSTNRCSPWCSRT